MASYMQVINDLKAKLEASNKENFELQLQLAGLGSGGANESEKVNIKPEPGTADAFNFAVQQANIEKLNALAVQDEKAIKQLTIQLHAEQQKVTDLQAELASEKACVAQNLQINEDLKKAHSKSKQTQSSKFQSEKKSNEAAQGKIATLQKKNDEFKREIVNIRTNFKRAEVEISLLKDQIPGYGDVGAFSKPAPASFAKPAPSTSKPAFKRKWDDIRHGNEDYVPPTKRKGGLPEKMSGLKLGGKGKKIVDEEDKDDDEPLISRFKKERVGQ